MGGSTPLQSRHVRRVHDGSGERVFAELFHRRRERQHVVCGRARLRYHGNHGGTPFGQRSGLIEKEGVDTAKLFQRFCIAKQNPLAGPASHADRDGHWGGQPQCAGAGDNQYRDGVGECLIPFWLWPQHQPGEKRDDRHSNHHGNKPA